MLPRWHILLGAIFTLVLWIIFPETEWYNLALVFLSSFLIDFDHYMVAVKKTGSFRLSDAFEYYRKLQIEYKNEIKKGIFKKEGFNVFHTVEFHLFVFLLGFLFEPFLYIFIGMVFHSLLDIILMTAQGSLPKREFFFVNWLMRKLQF